MYILISSIDLPTIIQLMTKDTQNYVTYKNIIIKSL
jgi:hypothetical protein